MEQKKSPSYLKQTNKKGGRSQERNHAADEPAEPQCSCTETHDPHGFLQPHLLLINHTFDDHGHRVNPGQNHEERHGAVQHAKKTVRGNQNLNL